LLAGAQRVERARDPLDADGAGDQRCHCLRVTCHPRQCFREFARGISEPEAQLEFLDDRQRRYETITLRVHARDHDPAAGRRRVDDVGDHALPSDRLEDHRAGRF